MNSHAWRLCSPWLGLRRAGFLPAPVGGRWHRPGDFVVYAWQSSELAAMSLANMTGAHGPATMLCEKLALPDRPEYYRIAAVQPADNPTPLLAEESNLPSQMVKSDLLGIWVPSSIYPAQRVLVLNPLHKAFPRVLVASSRLVQRVSALSGPEPLRHAPA